MGAPKRQRKKFSKPAHPWQKERILAEKELLKDYGLRRKYEIWKMNSILKNFTTQAKNLITTKNPQVEKERNQLLTKLTSLGLIGKGAKIEDVLSLTLKDIMERRLQTLVYRKNMANSLKQSRQLIVHGHISLGDKTITVPSYLVPLDEEGNIQFAQNSVLTNSAHPTRAAIKEVERGKKQRGKEVSAKKDEAKKKAEKKESKTEKKGKDSKPKKQKAKTEEKIETKEEKTEAKKK